MGTIVQTEATTSTPDQELLGRFLDERDEEAFRSIMRRHGAMVLAVCQRVLRNPHDAEDACQAAFLVLARKARSIRNTASLAGWLHGVAWLVANKLLTRLRRQTGHEKAAGAEKPASCDPADITWREVQRVLDDEVQRLPKVFAAPIILCYLEGRTQDEAAAELGWSVTTLRGRLKRARDMLRQRLTKRGITGASAIALAALVPGAASAFSPSMVAATSTASVPLASGQAAPVALSAHVLTLSQEVMPAASLLKPLASVLAIAAVVALALGAVISSNFFSAPVELKPVAKQPVWVAEHLLESPNGGVWCAVFSPDGKMLAAGVAGPGLASGELRVWNAETREVLYVVNTPHPVRCVAFALDGKTLATAEHDGAARLRDAKTGDVLFTLRGHKTQIDTVTFLADSKTVATSGWDQTVRLWDTASGREVESVQGHRSQVFIVTGGGPDGAFASAGVDKIVRLWEPGSRKPTHELQGHTNVIHWLAFAPPDGKLLASASWDKTVKLWDAKQGREVATLQGHAEPVQCVAFAPDGKTLASSACKRLEKNAPSEIVLWDVGERTAISQLKVEGRVYGVSFSPDGKTLAAACLDGGVSLWRQDEASDGLEPDLRHFVMAVNQPGAELPEFKKEFAKDFHPKLKADSQEVAGLESYGPDKKECVKFEPDGLRITLPIGYPRQRSLTGVITDFGLKGDFEITVNFEILQQPNAGLGGNPTDLKLVVVPLEAPQPEVWYKSTQNRASLMREAAGRGNLGGFHASIAKWDPDVPRDKWNNEDFSKVETHTFKRIPARSATGAMRMVRNGGKIYFLHKEGDQEFALFHQDDYTDKDIKNVRVVSTTGGPAALIDVRVTDLHIRADGFLSKNESPAAAEVAPAAVTGRSWWPFVAALCGVSALLALGGGGWLVLRLRKRPAVKQPVPAPTHETAKLVKTVPVLSFQCSQCKKRLKAKSDRAGKKVKCPHCSAVNTAPQEAA